MKRFAGGILLKTDLRIERASDEEESHISVILIDSSLLG